MNVDRNACRTDPVENVLRRRLAETVVACGADEATLWVISEDGASMGGALNDGPDRELLETAVVPVEGSVVGMVAAMGISASVGPGDPQHPAVGERTGTPIERMIVSPVRLDGTVCGALSAVRLQRDDGPRERFSADSLETLQQLAWEVGVTLERGDG